MSGRFLSVACSVRTPMAYLPYGASSGADGVTTSMRFVCASAAPAHARPANTKASTRRDIQPPAVMVRALMLASATCPRRDLARQDGGRQDCRKERQDGRRQERR